MSISPAAIICKLYLVVDLLIVLISEAIVIDPLSVPDGLAVLIVTLPIVNPVAPYSLFTMSALFNTALLVFGVNV
jgi:hypothetical protein